MAMENIKHRFAAKTQGFSRVLKDGNKKVAASMGLMGLGQILYGQWAKGLLYMLAEVGFIVYVILRGAADLFGFFTLGSVMSNPWLGIEGDNSTIMLIMGVLAFIVIILYATLYISNVRDVFATQKRVEEGKAPKTFREEFAELFDKKFYRTVLFLPVIGVCIFNVLPIVFMILVAFTNYGGDVVPPALVDWVWFQNFAKILTLGQFAPTFFKILSWNVVWAVLSTLINYFGGLLLALLLNKKCVRGKVFWRAFPILAYAIPGFITLLGFKFMFSYGGPINFYITEAGKTAVGFLDLDAKWTARIDGANAVQQFWYLTLPFVVFATTPVLITQFIGNFNNFGIFYFLRGGLYIDGYFLASDTDLLINWLYNLSIDNNYYSIGAAISLIIFIITSAISLAVYVFSPSYRQEETYR